MGKLNEYNVYIYIYIQYLRMMIPLCSMVHDFQHWHQKTPSSVGKSTIHAAHIICMYIYRAIAMKCYEPIHVGEYHPPICFSNIVILLQNTTMLEGFAVHSLLGIKCWDYMIIR